MFKILTNRKWREEAANLSKVIHAGYVQPKLSGAGKFSKAGAEKRKLLAADSAGAFQHVLADVVAASVMNETETEPKPCLEFKCNQAEGNASAAGTASYTRSLCRRNTWGWSERSSMSFMEGPIKLASFSKKAFISSSVSARMMDAGGEVQHSMPSTLTEWH